MSVTTTALSRLMLFVVAIATFLGGVLRLNLLSTSSGEITGCVSGTGWRLTYIPVDAELTSAVTQSLLDQGIDATVNARNVGETDSCGMFSLRSTDFTIELLQPGSVELTQEQIEAIYETLGTDTTAEIGHIELQSGDNSDTRFVQFDPIQNKPTLSTERSPVSPYSDSHTDTLISAGQEEIAASPATEVFNRNVLVVVYDPILNSGERLSGFLNWYEHEDLTLGTINHFSQASNNRVLYNVAETIVVDGWPEKVDGFVYTEPEYLAVYNGQSPSHQPDAVDYNKIVNDPQLDICGKANQGEIDEVWIYNGPWFGFYESTLVGPDAYYFNSGPVPEPFTCNRLIPIMGPSPERSLDSAVHNFGHRTESTMKWTYGNVWEQNSISHGWEKFALVNAQSIDFDYSGCGSIHYPPNAVSDYDYGNPNPGLTNCDDFINYPDLSDPVDVLQSVTCSSWGCNELGFFDYWFSKLPANEGCDVDNVANDWWQYFTHPELANNPSSLCPATPTPTPTSTNTPTPTNTSAPTSTATSTPIPTSTSTPTPTSTFTPASTATSTATLTPTNTNTPTASPTSSQTPTRVPLATMTPTLEAESGDGYYVFLPFVQR